MFWSQDEIEELKGTDVYDRIGIKSAENIYNDKIKPVLQASLSGFEVLPYDFNKLMYSAQKYPTVFQPSPRSSNAIEPFSLQHFHIQGSRILSRSFTVEASRAGRAIPSGEKAEDGDVSMRTSKSEKQSAGDHEGHSEDEDEEDEDEDEPSEQVMVPMADMLNAAYERDNVSPLESSGMVVTNLVAECTYFIQARLFHEDDCLKMISTVAIKKGEQIVSGACN